MRTEAMRAVVYAPIAGQLWSEVRWQLWCGDNRSTNSMPSESVVSGLGLEALAVATAARAPDSPHSQVSIPLIQTTLLIPAEAVITAAIAVPSSKIQHIRAAVPHLVEEWTASELDELHIAFGDRTVNGQVPVVAIDQKCFAGWLAHMDGMSGTWICESAHVDALLLPYQNGSLSVLTDETRLLIRWSEHAGGAVDVETAPLFLRALCRRQSFAQILLWQNNNANATTSKFIDGLFAELCQQYSIEVIQQPLESDPIGLLARNLEANTISEPLNVRQGAFKLINAELAAWRRWRPLAYASIAVLAGYIAINVAIGAWLDHRVEAMHAQSVALYRELFPQDKRIVNLQQQLLSHLGKGNSSEQAAFFGLFGQLAHAIKSTPGDSAKSAIQLRSLTFDANNGMLQVDIVMPSVSWLDALQKQLAIANVSTQVQSLTAEPDALVGRLRLGEGANRNAR